MPIIIKQIHELIEMRDIRKAEAIIGRLLRSKQDPNLYFQLLLCRAKVRIFSSRPDEALQDLLVVKNEHPTLTNDPSYQELTADCYLARFETASVGFAQKNDVQHAQELYNALIQDYPLYDNLGWIHYQIGRAYLINANPKLAEDHFLKALFAPSTFPALTAYCYERLGFIAFYEKRQSTLAMTYLTKALHTYPASEPPQWLVQVYLLRSRILKEFGLEDALASAQIAYDIANDAGAKSVIAETLFTMAELYSGYTHNDGFVIEYLNRFMQISKSPIGIDVTWSRAHEMMGNAYANLEKFDQAISAYQNALQCNPYHPWEDSLRFRIAKCYYELKQPQKAIQIIGDLIHNRQSVDYQIYHLLGNAHYALNQYKLAIQAYETAIELAPAGTNIAIMQDLVTMAKQLDSPFGG